jgi:diguanylate cyclase (GGDEF)-like protein/PAS domain S-box-containing protein
VDSTWLDALLADCRDALLVVDTDGELLFSNAAAAAIFGELLDTPVRSWLSRLHGEDLQTVLSRWEAAAAGTIVPGPVTVRLRGADDQPWLVIQADARHLPPTDSQGHSGGYVITARDLTASRSAEDELRASEARFRALDRYGYDVSVIVRPDQTIAYASPAWEERFGYRPEDLVGRSGWDFLHPDDAERVGETFFQALAGAGVYGPIEYRLLAADGTWRWVEEVASSAVHDPAVGGVVLNVRDVTETVRAREEAAAQGRRLQMIFDTLHEGVWHIDRDCRVTFASQHVAQQVGRPLSEIVGQPLEEVLGGEQGGVVARIRRRRPGQVEQYESLGTTATGEPRWMLVNAVSLADEDGTFAGSVASTIDITEGKRMIEELRRLALYDTLTGLPNRALFEDRLHSALAGQPGRTLTVLSIDVDNTSLVNARSGYAAGDQMLRAVGVRLQRLVPPQHTVARIDGDQFAVLLVDTDVVTAQQVAASVAEGIARPFEINDQVHYVTVSIGIAPTPEATPNRALPGANLAMLAAKTRGRARIEVFDEDLNPATIDPIGLVADLHQALRQDQLTLHYQPVLDLDSRGCVGVEALVRWHHPTRGLLPPDAFVPLAQESNLIGDLGTWVMRRACLDAASWPAGPFGPLHVAVNVSARQLSDRHLVDMVDEALRDAGLAAERLVVEITETAAMDSKVVTVLEGLRARGIRVALDDFGTGYGTLSHLKHLTLDQLKIDRSFVTDVVAGTADAAIVACLSSLAAGVRLDLVAEGVETREQAEVLHRLGCRYAQGYLWSPAVPADELTATIARLRPRVPRQHKPAQPPLEPKVSSRILTMHRNGASDQTIAAALNRDGLLTPRGARWHRTTVAEHLGRLAPGLDR